jgi:hypothetical protein
MRKMLLLFASIIGILILPGSAFATSCPAVAPPTNMSKTFTVSAANLPAVEAAALADGWNPQDADEIVRDGIVLGYVICGVNLELTIERIPFYVATDIIWMDVNSWIVAKAPLNPPPAESPAQEF